MILAEVELLAELRELGRQMQDHPERFTGHITVNAKQGGVTHFNVSMSWRRENGKTIVTGG